MRLTARAIIVNEESGKILLINYLNENANSTKEFTKGFGYFLEEVLKITNLLRRA